VVVSGLQNTQPGRRVLTGRLTGYFQPSLSLDQKLAGSSICEVIESQILVGFPCRWIELEDFSALLDGPLVLWSWARRWPTSCTNGKRRNPYPKSQDWVFPSFKLRGQKPRTGSIMAQDYLRPAAVRAGVLAEGDRRRFGFHNLRHSLASYLVTQTKTDIKTVQAMLRHADSGTTLDLYTHAINSDKLCSESGNGSDDEVGSGELSRVQRVQADYFRFVDNTPRTVASVAT
jgi:hypothetical protein